MLLDLFLVVLSSVPLVTMGALSVSSVLLAEKQKDKPLVTRN